MLNDLGGDRVPENRKHPRKSLHSPVAFRSPEGPRVEAMSRDISLGGLFIETPSPPPYGATVRVFIVLPGLPKEIEIDAVVRWSKPDGMGVQFAPMGARETFALTKFITGDA
jgi:hypothetical protein